MQNFKTKLVWDEYFDFELSQNEDFFELPIDKTIPQTPKGTPMKCQKINFRFERGFYTICENINFRFELGYY